MTYVIRFEIHCIIFQRINYTKNIERKDLDEQRRSIFMRDEHRKLKKQPGRKREKGRI